MPKLKTANLRWFDLFSRQKATLRLLEFNYRSGSRHASITTHANYDDLQTEHIWCLMAAFMHHYPQLTWHRPKSEPGNPSEFLATNFHNSSHGRGNHGAGTMTCTFLLFSFLEFAHHQKKAAAYTSVVFLPGMSPSRQMLKWRQNNRRPITSESPSWGRAVHHCSIVT